MKNVLYAIVALLLTVSTAYSADADKEFTIIIKDHKFEPAELKIPAGQKIKITVDNQDATPEEFESHELHREKVIQGNSKAVIVIGPLKAGSYKYFGEFNEATAQGVIIVE